MAAPKFAPHVERLRAVAGSRSGRLLAMGGAREAEGLAASTVHVLSASKLKAQAALAADAAVSALCFLDDDLLIAGTEDGSLLGWDAGAEQPSRLIELATGQGNIVALAADAAGKRLGAVDSAGYLYVFDLEVADGKPRLAARSRRVSARPQRAVAFDPTTGVVACGGDDGVVRTFNEAQLDDASMLPREMRCGEGGITALAFPGDGRVVAGCGDGSLRICYLEGAADEENRSGEAAHTGAVRGLSFGAQLVDEAGRELPRRLFSAGEDGQLKAWQLETKRKPQTVELSSAPLFGMTLLAASSRAAADKRGGTLAVVDKKRRLLVLTVNERSEPNADVTRYAGELERLAQEAQQGNEKVRTAALEELAALGEDEARQQLDRVLTGDSKAELRLRAAEICGQTGRRRSRPALRQALDDAEQTVRQAALAALTQLEADAPLAALRAALSSRHADIRIVSVQRLPELRGSSPLVPGLVAGALGDADEKVRKAAIGALWALESDPKALTPVRTALARGPADVRAEALLRLGLAHRTADAEGRALLEAAYDDADTAVRSRALLVAIAAQPKLAARLWLTDPHTGRALAELRKEGSFADDLPEGTNPLELVLGDDDLQPLFAALASRSADTALRGARCLALLPDPRATGALLQLSREGAEEIRRFAVEALLAAALAQPADDRLTARLEWLLDDEDATVRTWAFNALTKLAEGAGTAGVVDVSELALRTAHEDVRVRALQQLVHFGGEGRFAKDAELARRADALLGDALDDESGKVRAEAFRTLLAWHAKDLKQALQRAMQARHADIRGRVVGELARQKNAWADALLLDCLGDSSPEVGRAAYEALTEPQNDKDKKRVEGNRAKSVLHEKALASSRAAVRALACVGAGKWAKVADVRQRLQTLVRDEEPEVHRAAIEAADALMPDDQEAFAAAFGSRFYALRVRAGELCGKRRDVRAVEPMKELLTIPKGQIDRPSDGLRQAAARALADVGDPKTIAFYVSMLDDEDGVVREMGARGLAAACGPGSEQPLVDALAHADLAVRSWAAEGLARLGDDRAITVLAGTLKHEHRPIRLGAILSFVALGADGVRGILQGLEDPDREIQEAVFGIIVARDVALARAGLPPDLLLSALASAHPEIRFAAARCLEVRTAGQELGELAQELVGPRKPEKAADLKEWPAEGQRAALLNVLIAALASDHPAQRYAAARVLSLRPQALAFWREVQALAGPRSKAKAPFTSWEDDETRQPRKKDWIRRLFGRRHAAPSQSHTERVLTVLRLAGAPDGRAVPPQEASFEQAEVQRLAFGTYAGLLRQTPPAGEADETHRVRRDSLERLGELAKAEHVGRDAVLPVLRRALSDPNHLVRKAALSALSGLYPDGALTPLGLALESSAADIGRGAVDALIEAARGDAEQASAAAELVRSALGAGNNEVRAYALTRLPRLYEEGSLEPWLLALSAQHADVRMAVVDRLADERDERVAVALERAMESDHEDLRLKAAAVLARRGDVRTVDVLGGLLRAEEARTMLQALAALVALAHARPREQERRAQAAAAAATVVAARLLDDPDKTADRGALVDALGKIQSAEGGETLLVLATDGEQDAAQRKRAFEALRSIALLAEARPQLLADGSKRQRYDEPLLLSYLERVIAGSDIELRIEAARVLRDVDDSGAEALLAKLVDDRDQGVRVAAAEALAFRTEVVAAATIDPLIAALRGGRRELVLPAAAGLASRRRPEAFQALLLVFKAGEGVERERAVLGLGTLGDRRALEELEPLVDARAEIPEEDKVLAPTAAEALGRLLPRLEGEEAERVRATLERLVVEAASPVRLRTLTGLRHAGDDRSRAVLERVALDRYEDRSLRLQAVKELGQLAVAGSEAALAALLDADESSLRLAAVTALGRVVGDRTRSSLLALRSRHGDISQPAAAFLARRGDAETLVRRLGEIDDAEVRRRLRQGLVRRAACPADALAALLAGKEPAARAEAAWIAGAAASQELAVAVRAALDASASDWRGAREQHVGVGADKHGRELQTSRAEAWRASLWAAKRLGIDAGAQAREALGSGHVPAPVRREAARFLARHGTASDMGVLTPALSDPDAGVRSAAAAAAAMLAPEQAASVLAGLAVGDAAALRPMVAAALPSASKELLLSASSRSVALPVALGDQRVEGLIAVAQASGKDPARLVAIAALGRIGGEAALAALEALHANEAEEDAIRSAAYNALRRLQRAVAAEARFADGRDKDSGSYSGGYWGGDDDDDDDDWDDDDDDDDEDWDDDDDEDDDD